MSSKLENKVAILASIIVVTHLFLLYGLPPIVFIVLLAIAVCLLIFSGGLNSVLISLSFLVVTAVLWSTIKLTGLEDSIYYRPHEKFAYFDNGLGRKTYSKNVDFEMDVPYGDLIALSKLTTVPPKPRRVIFKTDSQGNRNEHDFHGQEYALVGDSFIAGSGLSQQHTITSQLLQIYSIDTYNLAHPGDVQDYITYIKSFRKNVESDDTKFLLFLFEGNDFPKHHADTAFLAHSNEYLESMRYAMWRYYKVFSDTSIYRFIYSTSRSALALNKETQSVVVKEINGKRIAFLESYIRTTVNEELLVNPETENAVRSVADSVSHLVFIPTKYRVYYQLLSTSQSGELSDLPNKQWEYVQVLGRMFDIPTIDLTPDLSAKSAELLADGSFTYWEDDTHWNQNGVAVAAKILFEKVFANQVYPD
ncbi:MAG: hypothetical protein R3E82_05520 [Pseudomonadales bacterium]